ncbi:hypothetical protein [Streptomyces sp. AP-93]|uniref:Vgb family protein n=1 Tax=Streptomyces sp. AP-93 TaxID=2929048 RepID=UPI001FAFFEC5|nr:hypothetical protein [Streptomyces sp. AP-93]MCJ0871558.1 hypothetical protein [Streptomyces sp. AP-93]
MPGTPTIRRRLDRLLTASLGALLAVATQAAPALADVGDMTEYPVTTPESFPAGITAGPDRALWFTESGANKIGRITTGGAVTEFDLPTESSFPFDITQGPDRALWFTEGASDQIGRITPTGAITLFPRPNPGGGADGITRGPDGNMW